MNPVVVGIVSDGFVYFFLKKKTLNENRKARLERETKSKEE